ncbi:MAG TPA: hypothetical protein VFM71_09310 [Gemmatimonadaceae bacterium]|nr:hypothetical protein [Gemmatimonadaceae bacterium]
MPARHDHTPWSDDELAMLRRLAAEGLGSAQSARRLNDEFHGGASERTTTTVNLARTRHGIFVDRRSAATARAEAPVTDAFAWLEGLKPVAVPAPSLPRATVTPTKGLTIIGGDFHFGCHDERALSVFVEACRLAKPSQVILNGDLPDLLAVSKYPADMRKRHNWTLGDEATAMHGFLRELEAAVPRTTTIVETEANHSGNGTASRWWRYLSDRAGALVTLPGAEAKLSYQAWWHPEWSRLQLVETVLLANDLLVLHGDIVRKHAAYSARATMEKWSSSVMHSHTHRQGSGAQRVPGIPGRPDGVQRFYEIGCLCNLEPSYASAPNWTQGFAIVREDGEDYGVELVTIDKGRAVVNTLGATVKAA